MSEVARLSKVESLPEAEPILRDLAAGAVHSVYPVKNRWYTTDKGIRFKLVGEWNWLLFAGKMGGDWLSGEVQLTDGSKVTAEIRFDTCKPLGWWARVFG